jgi:glycosyltransferase involved in cell wall biosynthesis
MAAAIRKSGYFDEKFYVLTDEARAQRIDPILHYLLEGEKRGIRPSEKFDPVFYKDAYPDVAAFSFVNALYHYLTYGKSEGRLPFSIAGQLVLPKDDLDPQKRAIVVVCHEASRTGAPILGWNLARTLSTSFNVVIVLVKGGKLESAFAQAASVVVKRPDGGNFHDAEAKHVANRIVETYHPLFVIANSVETRSFVPGFTQAGVPVIALVHEFSGNTRPLGILNQVYEWAAHIVFSAKVVEDASRADYPILSVREVSVVPQGPCVVPADKGTSRGKRPGRTAQSEKLKGTNEMLVVGMGAVQIRKGVDLFIAIAADVRRLAPESKIRFAWIGQGYDPKHDVGYSAYLAEQISRSHLREEDLVFVNEVDDLEPIYAQTDIFLLSSRLDPLPNVAIDAMIRGIPLICFENATGIAEVLSSEEATGSLVVPYMDIRTAAETIVSLTRARTKLHAISSAVRSKAISTFNMKLYVETLDHLGRRHADAWKQIERDRVVIDSAQAFDDDFYLSPAVKASRPSSPLLHYLVQSHLLRNKCNPDAANYLRRPRAGFHPLIYASENNTYNGSNTLEDPFAHFLRTNRPAGRWGNRVIKIPRVQGKGGNLVGARENQLRVALHGHFYYSDLLSDFLMRLDMNRYPCDLFITTTTQDNLKIIREATKTYQNGKVQIVVTPNKGRDVGPFLMNLSKCLDEYDVVGHVHSKRSVIDGDNSMGEKWRNFLWCNLIGDHTASSMDTILDAFEKDKSLGLVFPEDPNMVSWGRNLAIATQLMERMGMGEIRLPPHFDFPIGNMFWARTSALAPFKRLDLSWKDYPKEPLPYDGTMLHAMERLTPFVVEASGYAIATTSLNGVTR